MDAYSDNHAAGRIIVVCGPTATGKTKLVAALCRALGGEMVGADSMQVYEGLPIGTAAPRPEELGDVPAHLIGFLPPETSFSVADYLARAVPVAEDIIRRNAVPVFCGGTGLYISALVNGISFTEEKPSPERRAALYTQWERQGPDAMLARLAALDPEYAARLHPADKKRILRALEASEQNGSTLAQRNAASLAGKPPFGARLIGLDYESRQMLYEQIERRVDGMMAEGLLEEARSVYENRQAFKTAVQAIGYKEIFPYFEGEAPLAACVEKLKQATRNYSKRQLTWFRRMEGVHWLDAASPSLVDEAVALVEKANGKER